MYLNAPGWNTEFVECMAFIEHSCVMVGHSLFIRFSSAVGPIWIIPVVELVASAMHKPNLCSAARKFESVDFISTLIWISKFSGALFPRESRIPMDLMGVWWTRQYIYQYLYVFPGVTASDNLNNVYRVIIFWNRMGIRGKEVFTGFSV